MEEQMHLRACTHTAMLARRSLGGSTRSKPSSAQNATASSTSSRRVSSVT
jgi:hypothetical protein